VCIFIFQSWWASVSAASGLFNHIESLNNRIEATNKVCVWVWSIRQKTTKLRDPPLRICVFRLYYLFNLFIDFWLIKTKKDDITFLSKKNKITTYTYLTTISQSSLLCWHFFLLSYQKVFSLTLFKQLWSHLMYLFFPHPLLLNMTILYSLLNRSL